MERKTLDNANTETTPGRQEEAKYWNTQSRCDALGPTLQYSTGTFLGVCLGFVAAPNSCNTPVSTARYWTCEGTLLVQCFRIFARSTLLGFDSSHAFVFLVTYSYILFSTKGKSGGAVECAGIFCSNTSPVSTHLSTNICAIRHHVL